VELSRIGVDEAGEIERGVSALASSPNGDLIMSRTVEAIGARDVIVALAARYRPPAIYPYRTGVAGGGLASYGPDEIDDMRKAAGYVDRIFNGEKQADLPVQAPTKYELAINLKAAKAISLTLPPSLLARARPACWGESIRTDAVVRCDWD
jgi:putative tryptophan/tyrosine transport system substrate-binding protein